MRLKKVKTVEELEALAGARRSVICKYPGNHPMPAAVVLSMQCRCVLAYIKSGLFVYEPKPKKEYHKNFQVQEIL